AQGIEQHRVDFAIGETRGGGHTVDRPPAFVEAGGLDVHRDDLRTHAQPGLDGVVDGAVAVVRPCRYGGPPDDLLGNGDAVARENTHAVVAQRHGHWGLLAIRRRRPEYLSGRRRLALRGWGGGANPCRRWRPRGPCPSPGAGPGTRGRAGRRLGPPR